jgi:endonuclease-3
VSRKPHVSVAQLTLPLADLSPPRARAFPRGVTGPSVALRDKALVVHLRLVAEYGPARHRRSQDALSELMSALLSHRTHNADTGRAFRALRERFATWEAVRDAPVSEVEAAIAACTWPEQKAPRIQAVLRAIDARVGSLSLDLLRAMSVAEGRAWLEALPGVGPKTSAAVMLFSDLRRAAMPVDCHHHRVALRLGLIPENTEPGPAHDRLRALLPASWGPEPLHDDHHALMTHGKRRCFPANPACEGCPVLDLCPEGQSRLGPA